MERILDPLFLGLSSGAITALVALGIVVVYRGSGHLNFAQGEMATLSAFIAWAVAGGTLPIVGWQIPLWLATIAAMVFGAGAGAITEVAIVRPLSKRSPLAVFVALIAVFLAINAFDSGKWGAPPQETMGGLFPEGFWRISGAVWWHKDVGNLLLMLTVAGLVYVLFQRTKIGLAMRAVASNPDSSRLVGVPTGMVLAGSWGLAGALAALAGTMVAADNQNVTAILMFNVFVYASAAATLGGLDSPLGAVVAGLGIGVVSEFAAEFAPGWIGQPMKLAVALICIFVVLLVKPSGLFGSAKVERV